MSRRRYKKAVKRRRWRQRRERKKEKIEAKLAAPTGDTVVESARPEEG